MKLVLLALFVCVAAASVPHFEVPEGPVEGAVEPESCTEEIKATRAEMVSQADKLATAYENAELAVKGLQVQKALAKDEFYANSQGKTGDDLNTITTAFKAKIAELTTQITAASKTRNAARNSFTALIGKANRLYPQYIKACPVESCETGVKAVEFANEKLEVLQDYIHKFIAGKNAAISLGRAKAGAAAIFEALRVYYAGELRKFKVEASKLAKQIDGACNTSNFASFLDEWMEGAAAAIGGEKK